MTQSTLYTIRDLLQKLNDFLEENPHMLNYPVELDGGQMGGCEYWGGDIDIYETTVLLSR